MKLIQDHTTPSTAVAAESSSLATVVSAGRSPFVLLQSLVTIVLSYQLLFSPHTVLNLPIKEGIVLGLLLSLGALMMVPARLLETGPLVGLLVFGDTAATTLVIYLSAEGGSELFLTYFMIILIAAFAPTITYHLGLSLFLCLTYAVVLYLKAGQDDALTESQFLHIPVLLIMAVFYGGTVELLRKGKQEKTGLLETIDALKQAQQALQEKEEQLRQAQKMEAIGRLAGGIAHDFNNLLTVITGYSHLVLNRLDRQEPSYGDVEHIKKAGERAASLTQQLLAFSRRQVLLPKVLDLNQVVASTSALLQRLLGEDVHLVSSLEPALGRVKADPGQLEQVVMNLVVNARDAMPQGGRLTIETANVEIKDPYRHEQAVEPGSYVMLGVSDTGCGIDAQILPYIFDPFFTTKGPGKGSGLGLSTVYGIVKQSAGHIFVYSEIGRGSVFKVYLPRVDAVEAVAVDSEAMPRVLPEGKETILLVEDEPGVRALVRDTLQRQGYLVLEARHGIEALMLSKQHEGSIHLLVTDVVMPQMGGREVADRAVAIRPDLRVLFMSGYTENAIVHHDVLDPGVDFLQKPFTPDVLIHKVRDVLDAAR